MPQTPRYRFGDVAIPCALIAWGSFVAWKADALPPLALARLIAGASEQAGSGAIDIGPTLAALLTASALLAAALLAAWGLGALALRITGIASVHSAAGGERHVIRIALGLGCVMLALLAASCAGMLGVRASLAILAVGLACALWRLREDRRAPVPSDAVAPAAPPAQAIPWQPGAARLVAAGLIVLALATAMLCVVPELNYDALFYHLADARLDLLHGHVPEQPHNIYSRFPQGIELLFAWTLALSGGEALPRLLHVALWGLTATTAGLLARRLSSPLGGWMAAALFASTPVAILNASTALVDFGTAFFAATAVLAIMPWLDDPTASPRRIAVPGLLAGLAMSCKYSGVVPAGALGLIILVAATRRGLGLRRIAVLGATFAACATMFLGPWLVRNMLIDGNPVAPFAAALFGDSLDPEAFGRLLEDMRNRVGAGPAGWIALPWTLAVEQRDWHHWLGPAWLALAPMAIWPRLPRSARWPCLFGFATLAVSIGLSHIVRLAFPALAILAAIIGARLAANCRSRLGVALTTLALAVPVVGAALSGVDAALGQRECVQVLLGRESAGSYLERSHPGLYPHPSHGVIEFANASLPLDAVVLLVGETRGAHLERRFVTTSAFDAHPLYASAAAAATGDELADAMLRKGITHLIVNERELIRTRGDEVARLPPRVKDVLNEFFRGNVVVLLRHGAATLLVVTPRGTSEGSDEP